MKTERFKVRLKRFLGKVKPALERILEVKTKECYSDGKRPVSSEGISFIAFL
jgi:hypothetical protein